MDNTDYGEQDWNDAVLGSDELSHRVDAWSTFGEKYKKPNPDNFDIHNKDLAFIDSSTESEDSDISEAEEAPSTSEDVEPLENATEIIESLRPKFKKMEKLLPKHALLPPDPLYRQDLSHGQNLLINARRFSVASNYERSNEREIERDGMRLKETNHTKASQQITVNNRAPSRKKPPPTDSDDSMCSMEQDNYLRKNMGKRRPNLNPSQKIVCKKTIIKRYMYVNTASPTGHRNHMPFYASPSSASNSRRRKHKATRNRIISTSESDSSSRPDVRRRRKRQKVSHVDRPIAKGRQASPVVAPSPKLRDLAIVVVRAKPSQDMDLGNLLNIGKEKPERPVAIESEKAKLTVTEAPEKVLDLVEFISSDTDDGGVSIELDDVEQLDIFKRFAAPNSVKPGPVYNCQPNFIDLTDTDDIVTPVQPKSNARQANKTNPVAAHEQPIDRTNEIVIYKGNPDASPNAIFCIDRTSLEPPLGKELTDKLLGDYEFKKTIPATTSAFYVPQLVRCTPKGLSSDDEGIGVSRLGYLRYQDEKENLH